MTETAATPNRADLQRRLGLHDNEYLRLEQLASDNDRTVAAEIRRAIRAHIEAQEATT